MLCLARYPGLDFNNSFVCLCEFALVLFDHQLCFVDDGVSPLDQALALDRILSTSKLVDKFWKFRLQWVEPLHLAIYGPVSGGKIHRLVWRSFWGMNLVPHWRIDTGYDYVRRLAKNKVFPGQLCRSLFETLAGGAKALNGFQPKCIPIAEDPREKVVFRNFHAGPKTVIGQSQS
jgi:hypothetical protein